MTITHDAFDLTVPTNFVIGKKSMLNYFALFCFSYFLKILHIY